MEPTKLFEVLFGTPWATPAQCEAVAVLAGRQMFAQDKPRRDLLAAHQAGDVMPTMWRRIAREV